MSTGEGSGGKRVNEQTALTAAQRAELGRLYQDQAIQKTLRARALRLAKYDQNRAEELLQEGWRKAVRSFSSFQASQGFIPWFQQILINTFIDSLRRRRGQRSLEELPHETDTAPDPEHTTSSREWVGAILEALNQLPPHQREVARLRYIEDMDPKEIAVHLKIPLNTVNTRLFRLRPTLLALLQSRFSDIHEESTHYRFDRLPKTRGHAFTKAATGEED